MNSVANFAGLNGKSTTVVPDTRPSRDLLFGLLALQNGMVSRDQLVAAFGAWTVAGGRALADLLVEQRALTAPRRDLLEALAEEHLSAHGSDPEKSLASLDVNASTRESLSQIGDVRIEATLAGVGSSSASSSGQGDPNLTANYSMGAAGPDGQRFRILRPHAKGCLGAVFVALDLELNREVALKQILDAHAHDPVSRQRFLLEAEVTGGLEHPGIVPVYGLGTYADSRPYYAMRFVRGDTLKEAIDHFHADDTMKNALGRRLLELRKLLRRFTDVCNAIDYAHSRGVLHRDIKPANIVVGRYGETLVVDWGLAKVTGRSDPLAGERTLLPSSSSGSSETLPGSALGTPAYMSPEQAEGDLDRLSARSDVYSLGATLYCLLTGRPPFAGAAGEVVHAVQRGEYPPPRQLDGSVDPALEAVCLKAMALRPADRYPTPRALADDVDKWAADEPVTAWREPASRRARRSARRNRTAVTAASVALVAGVVGLAAVLLVQTTAKAELARLLASETKANRELADSRAAVQARFDLAVDAIKAFHTGVSEDFLLKEARFKALRDGLLESASDFYGKLGALLGRESDLAARLGLLQANFEVAELTGKVGRQEHALEAHRKVLAAREALSLEPGAGDQVKVDVARSLTAIGLLLESLGKPHEAEAAYREAEQRLDGEKGQGPPSAPVRAALGYCRNRLGRLLTQTGHTANALAMLRLARADQEAMAEAQEATDSTWYDLSSTINAIGVLLSSTGKTVEAEAEYRKALEIRQRLAQENPGVARYRSTLASSHKNLGNLLANTGRGSEAEVEYREALSIERKLADESPAVTAFRSSLASSHSNLGMLLAETSRASEAEAEYRRALALQQEVVDDNPAATDLRSDLAGSHNNLGNLLSDTGRAREAEAEYRAALLIEQKVANDNPAITRFQNSLALGHNNLGIQLSNMGKAGEAEIEYRLAVHIWQRLSGQNLTVTEFPSSLALGHNNLGRLLQDQGKAAEAEAEYRAGLSIWRKLVADNPAETKFQNLLAVSHNNLGVLLSSTGKASEATDEYRRALAILQQLADDNPTVATYRGYLANAAVGLAGAHLALGRSLEARAAADQAVQQLEGLIEQDRQSLYFQSVLGEGLLRRGQARLLGGDVAGSAADWRRAVATYDGMPAHDRESVFTEACCHAMLAGAARRASSDVPPARGPAEADRAMTILRRAVSMRFREASRYRNELALEPLCARADFRLLMMDLAMPPQPFAP